jgi:hypothetical protein
LTFTNQFRWFEGDLPDADKQSNYTLLFQPALPFVLPSGDKIIWRPAVPLVFDQPIPKADGGFDGKSGLADIHVIDRHRQREFRTPPAPWRVMQLTKPRAAVAVDG